jgi:hypothetical protein
MAMPCRSSFSLGRNNLLSSNTVVAIELTGRWRKGRKDGVVIFTISDGSPR